MNTKDDNDANNSHLQNEDGKLLLSLLGASMATANKATERILEGNDKEILALKQELKDLSDDFTAVVKLQAMLTNPFYARKLIKLLTDQEF